MKKFLYSLILTVLAMLPGQVSAQDKTVLSFDKLSMMAGQTKELVVNLDNPDMQVWMMQFDLTLSEGLSIVKNDAGKAVASKTDRAASHSLTVNQTSDGIYHVLLYTVEETALTGNAGSIIKMNVVAADGFKGATVTASNIKVTNLANNKFTLANANLTVSEQIAVQVTANNATRKYGQANPELSYTVTPAGIDLTGKVTLACEATTTSGVGEYAITATAASVEDMIVTCVNGKLTVTPAQLTATAADASRVYGQDNPALTVSYTGFVNDETEAVLTEKPTVTTEATKASAVGTYPITVAGGKAANYEFAGYVAGKLTVTKANLTVTAADAERVYGQENPALTLSYDGFVGDDTEAVLKVVPTAATEAVATSDAGVYPITVSGGEADNYTIETKAGSLTVTKAPLLVTVADAQRMYGQDNPDFEVSYSGFLNDDTEAVLTSAPILVTEANASTGVGFYSIDAVGGEATNYELTGVSGTLEVTPAPLKVSLLDAERTYGGSDPYYEYVYEGFVNGDSEWVVIAPPSIITDADVLSPVGEYDITLADGEAMNYYFAEYVGAKLTVTKAPLIVAAGNATRRVGEENPELTITYDGFVNGDSEDVLDVKPVAATTATSESEAGTYEITVSGGESQNYEFEYQFGTLTILPKKEDVHEDNGSFVLEDDNTLTFTGIETEAGAEPATYEIPSTVEHNGNTLDVKAIAPEAFKDETSLESITIPESVESIGAEAFAGCKGLKVLIVYSASPITLGGDGEVVTAFKDVPTSELTVYVPDESVDSYKAAEGWSSLNIQPISLLGVSRLTVGSQSLGDVYDLKGRKVRSAATTLDGLAKGVYIIGGRKVTK